MDIVGWIKRFFFKICDKIEDRLASLLAGLILLITLVVCIVCWEWLKAIHSLKMYGWLWIFILTICSLSIVYSLCCMLRDRGRLKNPCDIVSAIDAWLAAGVHQIHPVEIDTPYYFHEVEKELYLKRGSSLKYLPMSALKHGYTFEMGNKTFKLRKLTPANDPKEIFNKHFDRLNKGEDEIVLSCSNIDNELGWPKGATKSFILSRLLTRSQVNVKFGIKVEDAGGDRVRIKRKN